MLKLIIEDDEGRKTVVPFARDEITIGREEGNTIRLTERNVSRRHARLLKQASTIMVEDLGSYNGIRINGDRIKGQVQLAEGDLIQIGDYDLAIQNEETQQALVPPTIAPATIPAVPQPITGKLQTHRPVDTAATLPLLPTVDAPTASDADIQEATHDDNTAPDAEVPRKQSTAVIRQDAVQGNRAREIVELSAAEAPRLVIMNTELAGREFTCSKTELRIGRTDENDFEIDHRSLSRTHCKIVRENNGEWRVIDMQSANGLLVNGEPYAQVTVRPGDVIELGHVKLKFVGPGEHFSVPRAASGETTRTDLQRASEPQSGGGSKGMLMVVAVLVLLGLVGAAVVVLKPFGPGDSGETPKHKPPPKDPKITDGTVQVTPPPKPNVPPAPTAEEIITAANDAIAIEDLDAAEKLLHPLDEAHNARAHDMLGKINEERSNARALNEAEVAITAGKRVEAAKALKAAEQTTMLKARFADLTKRLAELGAAKPPDKPTVVPDKPKGPTPHEVAEAKFNDGVEKLKAGELKPAVELLKACIKADASMADCYKKLGVAYTKLNDAPAAMKAYEGFLKVAPADHVDRKKVQSIVDGYNASK